MGDSVGDGGDFSKRVGSDGGLFESWGDIYGADVCGGDHVYCGYAAGVAVCGAGFAIGGEPRKREA